MVNLIGTVYFQNLFKTQEDNILKIFLNFINKKQWKDFSANGADIEIPKKTIIKPKKVKNVLNYLNKAFETIPLSESMDDSNIYKKFDHNVIENVPETTQNEIVLILYITIEAFLDVYSVQLVQDKIENLNERLTQIAGGDVRNESAISEHMYTYSVTEHFIQRYRTIFQVSAELVSKLYKLKESNELPLCVLKISNALGFVES